MAKALLFVFTNPASAEQEGEYNTWYDEIHADEVKSLVPGIVGVSRYGVDDLSRRSSPNFTEGDPDVPLFPQRYAAIYEIDADDPEEVVREIRRVSSKFQMSDALDRAVTPPAMVLLSPRDESKAARHP